MAKISIIGAGQVGSETAFMLANAALAEEIVLVDLNRERAESAAKDIAHGTALTPPVNIRAEDYPGIADSDIVIFAAGAGQKPGEKRTELAGRNRVAVECACREIHRYAPECILIVVTNPTDVLTKAAADTEFFPPQRVFGSGTWLDSLRFRRMIADHAHVDPRDVQAWVVGEHGDSEVPVWNSVRIGGMTASDFCRCCDPDCEGLQHKLEADFDRDVRNAAYEIIRGRGATSCGIAGALLRIVQAILRNEHSVITVSTCLRGEYGIHDAALSLPCIIGAEGIERVLPAELSESERCALLGSADIVRAVDRESLLQPV